MGWDSILYSCDKEYKECIADSIYLDLIKYDRYFYNESDYWEYYRDLGIPMQVDTLTIIFVHLVRRGYIFCDDIFHSTLKKYIKTDISPNLPEIELFCMFMRLAGLPYGTSHLLLYNFPKPTMFVIWYDFCKLYMSELFPLIKMLCEAEKKRDMIINHLILNDGLKYEINNAIKKCQPIILDYYERTHKMPYLNTKNNWREILSKYPSASEEAFKKYKSEKQDNHSYLSMIDIAMAKLTEKEKVTNK